MRVRPKDDLSVVSISIVEVAKPARRTELLSCWKGGSILRCLPAASQLVLAPCQQPVSCRVTISKQLKAAGRRLGASLAVQKFSSTAAGPYVSCHSMECIRLISTSRYVDNPYESVACMRGGPAGAHGEDVHASGSHHGRSVTWLCGPRRSGSGKSWI